MTLLLLSNSRNPGGDYLAHALEAFAAFAELDPGGALDVGWGELEELGDRQGAVRRVDRVNPFAVHGGADDGQALLDAHKAPAGADRPGGLIGEVHGAVRGG